MSVTVVALLVVAGLGCAVVLTALFAMLQAAALGDMRLEHAAPSQPTQSTIDHAADRPEIYAGLPPSGRFARAAHETQDQPLVR